jgi:hypothetical protein
MVLVHVVSSIIYAWPLLWLYCGRCDTSGLTVSLFTKVGARV